MTCKYQVLQLFVFVVLNVHIMSYLDLMCLIGKYKISYLYMYNLYFFLYSIEWKIVQEIIGFEIFMDTYTFITVSKILFFALLWIFLLIKNMLFKLKSKIDTAGFCRFEFEEV